MKNNGKNTITQFKMYIDLDKELEYINMMNKQGWKLVYIKGGCFYSFVRTQPDEYFTTMYADDKNNISQVTTFAAQCGYENVPHTMDCLGTLLYLTAPKGKVSEEFACDRELKIKYNSKLSKYYLICCVAILIIALLLILETVLYFLEIASEFNIVLINMAVIVGIIGIIYAVLGIFLLILTLKSRKKIKQLKNDSLIYE